MLLWEHNLAHSALPSTFVKRVRYTLYLKSSLIQTHIQLPLGCSLSSPMVFSSAKHFKIRVWVKKELYTNFVI